LKTLHVIGGALVLVVILILYLPLIARAGYCTGSPAEGLYSV
jgi:hypothetical protein